MGAGWIALVAVGVVVFFSWGWVRASRFTAEHGRSPWGLSPVVWGIVHVVLFPIAWILYFGARRSTRIADSSLTSVPDAVYADTAEEREALLAIVRRLPLLPPPQPARRGWFPDPLGQAAYRFFDGQRWGREVSDEPAVEPVVVAPEASETEPEP